MRFMKQLFDISSDVSFYLVLGFLFLINFSIAACYFLATFLLIVFIASLIRNRAMPRVPKFYKYFLVYILFTLVSTIFSIDELNSLEDNKEIFVFLLIPIFLAVIDSEKRLRYSLFTVLSSAVISALIGIFITLKEQHISLDHRLQGLTSHWMTYSGLLMLVFIFFLVYLFYEKTRKTRIIISLSLVLILAAILLSLTRSVWVGIFAALGIFIIYYKPRILYAAVPALIILAVALPNSVKNRLTSIVDPKDATNRDRIYMYSTGIKIFKDYPITGVGANNIEKVYDQYKPAAAEQTNLHLHNNFLHVLAERGILALVSLLIAFVSIFFQLIKKIKNSVNLEKGIASGVLFLFIGFLVAGLFEYNFGDTEIKFLLFYFLSIPFCQPKPAAASI